MGLDDGGDFFRSGQRSGGPAEKKATMSSMAACRAEDPPTSVASNVFSANIAEQVLMGDWNLFVSMAQHMDFGGFTAPSSSGACVQANEWIDASGGSLTEQVTGLLGFNDGDISQLMSSAALSANGQIAGPLCAADLNLSGEHGVAKDSKGKKRRKIPEHDAFGSRSPTSRIQTAETGQKKEVISGSAKSPTEEDVKKEKDEQKPRASTHKLASKQAKESSSSKGDADKEDYIHLRAKRGHATNSHSLAERVRRQKISERMKFLQDLVPGCSKITGKAVMLDEIINYIQSLQHQVEFLSMKLATVNPEVNLDVEKIVSKEAFYSQTGGSGALGFCPGFISSHPPSRMSVEQGAMQVEMAIHNNPNSREELKSNMISPLPEISNMWKGGLQNVTQVSCFHSGHLDARTDPPASTKTDKSMRHERNVGAHG